MKSITIRGINDELHNELEKLSEKEHKSLNKTIITLLEKAIGFGTQAKFPLYDDLDYLAGTWTDEDEKEFNKATLQFSTIDKEIWK